MFHEYRDIITQIKQSEGANSHFMKVFERHNELDDLIAKATSGELPLSSVELENMKKEKLALKDEAYAMILKFKKETA